MAPGMRPPRLLISVGSSGIRQSQNYLSIRQSQNYLSGLLATQFVNQATSIRQSLKLPLPGSHKSYLYPAVTKATFLKGWLSFCDWRVELASVTAG